MDAGLLPVKRLDAAKGRLQGYFDAKQRVELAAAMLEDALDLCSAADFLVWHVVSADRLVLERATDRGFDAIADPDEGGLDASLRHAISALPPEATSVTVIPVDAPLTSLDDLRDLTDTGALSDVVVVPADRDAGTNG